MSSKPLRIYWDACAWISLINKEMPIAGNGITHRRFEMCLETIKKAEAGELEIVTSAFTLSEVCKKPLDKSSPSVNLPSFFDQRYILLINVDKHVGIRAQNLQLAGLARLRPPDAIHLASALIADTAVFHTFDDRLLSMSDRFALSDATTMKIVRPTEEVAMPELLKRMQKDDEAD